jgi:hypothetical protein
VTTPGDPTDRKSRAGIRASLRRCRPVNPTHPSRFPAGPVPPGPHRRLAPVRLTQRPGAEVGRLRGITCQRAQNCRLSVVHWSGSAWHFARMVRSIRPIPALASEGRTARVRRPATDHRTVAFCPGPPTQASSSRGGLRLRVHIQIYMYIYIRLYIYSAPGPPLRLVVAAAASGLGSISSFERRPQPSGFRTASDRRRAHHRYGPVWVPPSRRRGRVRPSRGPGRPIRVISRGSQRLSDIPAPPSAKPPRCDDM